MAQPTTQFWPIFPLKSDGQDVVNQKGTIVRNGPTQEQLDRTPNEQGQCDYYRLIDKDEPKHVDWRKKLGGMLLREIGGRQHEDKWQQSILWDFPENYRLYEHIKSKADGQTKVKNHSGGGHDRQDAYLYGFPKGPRKRFRSPIEFFPHLLWLCTDESSDYQNCSCRICSPVQLEADRDKAVTTTTAAAAAAAATTTAKVELRPEMAVKKDDSPATTVPASQTRSPAVQPPLQPLVRRLSAGSPAIIRPAPASAPRINPPQSLQSTLLPQPRNMDQQIDAQYNKFVCRTGEVVWFYRPKTTAWGLGLIVRRWIPKDASSDRAYLIQPLSYPFDTLPPELVTTNQYLKPWLAWSAPSCTYAYLQRNTNLTYDQVDWTGLMSGRYSEGVDEGVPDVDASILAAKAIDITYTPFDPIKTTTNAGVEERHWNGIFLGAEKIWRGEPVRLRIGSGHDLMVVTDITERPIAGAPQNPSASQPSSKVYFVGDLYTYATLPAIDGNPPPDPQPNSRLPMRMREDMSWRNSMLVPGTRTFAYWKLIATSSRLEISEIKGRWYETSIVFVEPFKKAVQNNEGGNGIWMNSRGDATGLGKAAGLVKPDRISAFGNSIPKNVHLVDGLDVPVDPSEQNRPPQHAMQGVEYGISGPPNADTGFALDDFMNLDGMEDGAMAFPGDFHF